MKKAFETIHKNLKFKQGQLKREFRRTNDAKAKFTGQKYEQADAQRQLEKCIANLKIVSGIKIEGDSDSAPADELTEAEKALAGWANFPQLCLNQIIELPYIYDLVKYDILKWEFHMNADKKKHNEERHTGCLGGLISHFVRLAQFKHQKDQNKDDKIWLAGYLGPGDASALEQLVPVKPCFRTEKTKEDKVKDGSIKKTPVGDDKSKG